jgi:hypothetical protein
MHHELLDGPARVSDELRPHFAFAVIQSGRFQLSTAMDSAIDSSAFSVAA